MCVSPQVPGNVQPDTPMFKAPGDYEIRTKEINNGVYGFIRHLILHTSLVCLSHGAALGLGPRVEPAALCPAAPHT
jgi:hypothetical protein